MRNIWKDFLYFSTREKISCILLLSILILFIILYVATSNIMKVNPGEINQQKILDQEFEEYEASLTDKEIVIEDSLSNIDIVKNSGNKHSTKSLSNKGKLSKDQIIDINSASEELLIHIPGIGKSTASKIIEYKNLLGGYSHLEQLVEIQGISVNKLSNLLPYLTIKKAHKIILFYKQDIQSLQNHPYVRTDQLELLQELKDKESISNIEELLRYYQFKQSDINRLSPYIDFSK